MLVWRSTFREEPSVVWDPESKVMVRITDGYISKVAHFEPAAVKLLTKQLRLKSLDWDALSAEQKEYITSTIQLALNDQDIVRH